MSERDPSVTEVVQSEVTDLQAVPVQVEGPVRAQQPGSPSSAMGRADLDTNAVRVIPEDRRRRVVRVECTTNACWLGFQQSEAQRQTGFHLPTGQVVPVTATDEIWARADTATAVLTFISELWTE